MNTRVMTFYWMVIWLGCGFAIPEGIAIATRHFQYTLSETAWRMLDVIPGHTSFHFTFLRFLVSALLFWLWLHITFGWMR